MASEMSSDEIRRDVRATLAARREVGPEFDDYFVEHFVQRLTEQLAPERRREGALWPTAGQRLALAIVSLCALVPIGAVMLILVAILAHMSGAVAIVALLLVLGVICGAFVAINVAFSRRR